MLHVDCDIVKDHTFRNIVEQEGIWLPLLGIGGKRVASHSPRMRPEALERPPPAQ